MTSAEPSPIERLGDHHDLQRFDSGVPDLDRWLQRTARTAGAARTATTYVAADGPWVVGYYALAMGSVAHDEAPSRLRRGMPDPVPAVLLARLAVDRHRQGSGLGARLLVDALRRAVRGGREIAARAAVVDAIDDRAAAFYEHFGFIPMGDGRLWQRISWLAENLG